MRLYQLAKKAVRFFIFLGAGLVLIGCSPVRSSSSQIAITIELDGEVQELMISAGATAREAFEQAGIELNTLDKSDPPMYTILQADDKVTLTRVQEEYIVEQNVLPYETQILRNESLAEGEQRLIQPGQNGVQEITYRVLYEDGVEANRTVSSSVIIESATSEIFPPPIMPCLPPQVVAIRQSLGRLPKVSWLQ